MSLTGEDLLVADIEAELIRIRQEVEEQSAVIPIPTKSKSKKKKISIPGPPPIPGAEKGCLGDPVDYVMCMFDQIIAPNLIAPNPTLTAIRRGIYRKVVWEIAFADVKDKTTLSVDEICNLASLSFKKAGLISF